MFGMLKGRVTASSQPEVLRREVTNAGLRHGETAKVNMRNVQAYSLGWGRGAEIRFCHIPGLEVLSRDEKGDGQQLPTQVRIKGLKVPEPGAYDLESVQIHSNGRIEVRCTSETKVRKVERRISVGV